MSATANRGRIFVAQNQAFFDAPFKSGQRSRNSRQQPCPICYNRSRSGKLSVGKCLILEKVVFCHNIESDKPANTTPVSWQHANPDYHGLVKSRRSKVEGQENSPQSLKSSIVNQQSSSEGRRARAEAAVLAEVGQWLLEQCPIAPHHAAALRAEGHNPVDYGTLPERSVRAKLAKELVTKFGEAVAESLPWLICKQGKANSRYWDLSGPARGQSLLVPVLDERGKIMAFQYKPDEQDPSGGKYRWLSGGQVEHGTPLHFAPYASEISSFNQKQNLASLATNSTSSEICLITEGRKKSDAWARWSGMRAVALGGVDAWSGSGLPLRLKKLGIKEVWVAFDADKTIKPAVLRAEKRLCEQLAAAGFAVKILNWPLETGKGLDDVLLEVENQKNLVLRPQPSALEKSSIVNHQSSILTLHPFEAASKFVEVEGEALAARFGAAQPLYSLEEARRLNAQQAEGWLARHAFGYDDKSRLVNTSTTGTGKSRAYDDAIARHAMRGMGGRVLLLAPNKDNIYERLRSGDIYTELGKLWANQKLHVQLGRQVRPLEDILRNPGQADCANSEAAEAGAMRQNARRVVCADCPFGSAENWQAAYGDKPMPWNCSQQGYIFSKKQAADVPVVLATKQAYLNGSSQLAEFDYIIVDEDLKPFLKEEIVINRDHTTLWRQAMRHAEISWRNRDENAPLKPFAPFEALLDWLDETLTSAEISAREGVEKFNLRFAICDLRFEETNGEGKAPIPDWGKIQNIVEACRGAAGLADENGRYPFERPFTQDSKRLIPLRAIADLLAALEEMLHAQHKPTRLRLEQSKQGAFYFSLRQLRHNLLGILNGVEGINYSNHFQTKPALAILNATPEIELDWVLPGLHHEGFAVAQQLEVTQVIDGLYTGRDLHNPATRARVAAVIEAVIANAHRPTILGRYAFTPGSATEPHNEIKISHPAARYAYFGRDHKATNQHLDSDMLVIYGHYLTPLDQIQADYELFSGRKTLVERQKPKAEGQDTSVLSTQYSVLKTYNWRSDSTGKGLARRCKAQADPELQRLIEWDYYASMLQAIGRLRAALRDPAKPARVVIIGGDVVGDLAINHLTTIAEILGQARISAAQKAALDKGRTDWNAKRAATCQQVRHTLHEMGQSGLNFISLNQLADYSGVIIQELIQLGYRVGQRVRVAPANKRLLPQAIHNNIISERRVSARLSFGT